MKNNKVIIIFSIILLFITLFISVGYSSFEKVFNIDSLTANVRINKDIRITNFVLDSVESNAIAEGEEFDYNMANVDLQLPNSNSSITYSVTVTNFGNVEASISNINVIGNNASYFDVVINDYNLGDILEDNNGECKNSEDGCILGISRTFSITLKNKSGILYPGYHYRNVYIDFQFATDSEISIGDNIFTSDMIIPNSYIETDGSQVSFSGWASSDFIDVSNYKQLILIGGTLRNWNACYDENKEFVSRFTPNSSYFYSEKLGNISSAISTLKISNDCKYIRVSENSNIISALKIYPLESENFDHHFKFIYNPVNNDEFIFGDNRMIYEDIVPNSYISNSNGSIISYAGWYSTGFIDIHDLDDYIVYSSIGFAPNQYAAYYDENYNYISRVSLSAVKRDVEQNYYATGVKPDNAYYVRFSDSSSSGYYYSLIVSSYEIKEFNIDPDTNDNLVVGENILNLAGIVDNKYIETNGALVDYSGWSYTDNYYPIGKGILVTANIGQYNAVYNSEYVRSGGLSCSGITMTNEYLGNIIVSLCYIRPTSSQVFVRFSNNTSALRNYRIYPILNDDFNFVFEFELR